jgi:NAD(P)-dependent dehydrogenase (short-subunit alcohol dehydrogenase family)
MWPFSVYKNTESQDLTGKVYLITGGTSGLGKEYIHSIAKYNPTIIFTGRSQNLASIIVADMHIEHRKLKIRYIPTDHSSLQSIVDLSEIVKHQYERLDCLVNNVGGFNEKLTTNDGHNYTIALNFYSHFLLTDQLYSLLRKTNKSRILLISSSFHKDAKHTIDFEDIHYDTRPYDMNSAYCESKLYCLLLARSLNYVIQTKGDGDIIKAVA